MNTEQTAQTARAKRSVTVILDYDAYRLLRVEAAKRECTMSKFIRSIIMEKIKQLGAKNGKNDKGLQP